MVHQRSLIILGFWCCIKTWVHERIRQQSLRRAPVNDTTTRTQRHVNSWVEVCAAPDKQTTRTQSLDCCLPDFSVDSHVVKSSLARACLTRIIVVVVVVVVVVVFSSANTRNPRCSIHCDNVIRTGICHVNPMTIIIQILLRLPVHDILALYIGYIVNFSLVQNGWNNFFSGKLFHNGIILLELQYLQVSHRICDW